MSSNTRETDDNDYQARYEDEEDEEEQLNTDDEENELDHLQADAHMPLDELFRLYHKNAQTINSNNNNNNNTLQNDDSFSSSELDDDDDDEGDDNDRRHHLLHVNGELLPDNDDDTEDSLYEPDIIKFINVGDEYQAHVESKAEYDSLNEHCDDREVPVDELLWSSSSVSDADNDSIDEYLKIIHTEYPSSDDEISLQTLLNCQLNTELALVKFRPLPNKTIYSYPAWSLAEIQQFEEGLRDYGKNFFKISVFKCLNRSVRELVHFYYQWKKSERYQLFIEEQQRINSLTSVSDIIEKFIEEREQQLYTATGVIDPTKSSSFISNDFKFHTPLSSNSSISFVTIRQQETTTTTTTITKRSFDQIDNDDEISPSSKKTSINTKTSSAEATATTV